MKVFENGFHIKISIEFFKQKRPQWKIFYKNDSPDFYRKIQKGKVLLLLLGIFDFFIFGRFFINKNFPV
jgi:hypothetical protein